MLVAAGTTVLAAAVADATAVVAVVLIVVTADAVTAAARVRVVPDGRVLGGGSQRWSLVVRAV